MVSAEKMLQELGVRAKKASRELNRLGVKRKNEGLEAVAKALILHQDKILAANEKDVKKAKENRMKESLVDRLSLTEERIEAMAEGLTQIVALEDPVGEVSEMKTSPLGMQIGQKRVPLGVIGIIYESRPNVTADAFGLCFKTGNAVILRGGSDALNSNLAITKVIAEALSACDLPADSIQLLTDTSHETAEKFMRLNEYIDVLIPRGGAGLIKTVVEKSTMSSRLSYIFNISGSDTLLTCCHTCSRRNLLSGKIWFQRCHASINQQQTFVILRHKGKTWQSQMSFTFKKFQIFFS